MKRNVLLIASVLFLLLSSSNSYSLTNFKYTGIAFDGSGAIIKSSTTVTVQIQLIVSGSVQYDETHSNVSTDQFGAYTVEVGTGTVNSGSLGGVTASKNLRIKSTTSDGGSSGVWVVSSILKPTVSLTSSGSGSSGGSYWGLSGNSGTTAGTNFIGTTDGVTTEIRVENSGAVQNALLLNDNQAIYRDGYTTGSAVAGNTRGRYSVDMQIYRNTATAVASGGYSVICGGDNNTASGENSFVGGGAYNKSEGTYSMVSGGRSNTASGSRSTIGGGGSNTASGQYSIVAGGFDNTASGQYSIVAGGNLNRASFYFSTVGGGESNLASQEYSTVAGGYDNTASGYYSTIGGGEQNTASNWYSTVAGGLYAKADKYGQNAYAGGRFANDGDAQTSLFVVRNETTDNTPTYLYLDGTSATQRMTLNDQDRWIFRALVVGASDDGSNYGSYVVTGYIYRNGGLTSTLGVTTTAVARSSASYNATAVANGTALAIQVTGDATNTMRWVARVEVAQLNY